MCPNDPKTRRRFDADSSPPGRLVATAKARDARTQMPQGEGKPAPLRKPWRALAGCVPWLLAGALGCASGADPVPSQRAGAGAAGGASSEGGTSQAGGTAGVGQAAQGGQGQAASTAGGSSASGGSTVSAGGSAGSSGGEGGSGGGTQGGTTSLPFVVDQYFAASGFMGDGVVPGAVELSAAGCDARPALAQGNCYRVDYAPEQPAQAGVPAWAGVRWQHPVGNWGVEPGLQVDAGATRVRFMASGATGGEVVRFQVGGISDSSLPYRDSFSAEITTTLTTDWQSFEISLQDASYDDVLGGFGWVVETLEYDNPVVFFIDDIVWE